jgi:hypothetical protein
MCNWIKSGNQRIDPCMRVEVASLELQGFFVRACCCGHGRYNKTIVIESAYIYEYYSKKMIERTKRFYKRDKQGVFFIPEVEHFNSQLKNKEPTP